MSNWKKDAELEHKVRDELNVRCVLAAEQWADEIEDDDLRREMNQLIREYEEANDELS